MHFTHHLKSWNTWCYYYVCRLCTVTNKLHHLYKKQNSATFSHLPGSFSYPSKTPQRFRNIHAYVMSFVVVVVIVVVVV
jgi:lipopolysaccharide biosynthesis glycosyltransferase